MTVEEMEDTLSRLGIETYNVRGDEIQALCPAHLERTGKEDRNPSWFINADTGAHICFSCGFKGSLYSLISYINKIEYDNVPEWLGSAEGLTKRFERVIQKRKPIEEVTVVTESMLKAFVEVPSEVLRVRGLSSASADKYGLRWDARHKNWIIPIRDPRTSELLGWQEKGFDHRYFNNRPTGVKKGNTLFGYNHMTDSVLVVESPLDVVRLDSIGLCGVATYGATVSINQFNLIRSVPDLIFAMDNDDAGRSSTHSMIRLASLMHVEARVFDYSHTDMKDVGAMGADEVRLGIENSKHIVRFV